MSAGGSSAKMRGILLAALLSPPLAAAAAEPPVAAPKPAEFCASLARVMAAAASGFEPLRGKAREDKGWAATEALPGTHGCTIETNQYEIGPLHEYRCAISSQDDDAVASADLEGMRRLVSQCLGESWRVGEVRHSDTHTVFFTRSTGEPSLELLDWRLLGTRHDVALAVKPPGVSVTLKGRRAGKAIDLDAPMDIKAKDEDAQDIFRAIGEALDADAFLDADAHGRVTLERRDMPLHEVLDAVCTQAGCVWSLAPGEQRPQLSMKRKKS